MDNYNLLLNEINEFLSKDIETDNNTNVEVISMYDLYIAIVSELKELRELLKDNSKLYKKLVRAKEFGFKDYKHDIFYNFIEDIKIKIDGNEYRIDIAFPICGKDECINIIKYKNVDDICISHEKSNRNEFIYNFTSKNYDYIMQIITQFEEYVEMIGRIGKEPLEHNMSNSNHLFIVYLRYNTKGEVNLELKINEKHPLASEYYKNWIKKERICDFANKHQDEILKHMIINTFEIPENFKKIYDKHIEKTKQSQKVKTKRFFR